MFNVISPAIKAILISCITIFIFQQLQYVGNDLILYGALWPFSSENFMIWQLVTYAFLHGSFFHIFFNLYILWAFGTEIENHWGTKHFSYYYAVCGIGAAILNLAVSNTSLPTIGASGSIYGVLLAYGMMFPDRIVLFYFLFPIKVKYLVIIYAFVEFFSGINSVGSNIAHFAHLGGMMFGFLYIKIMRGDIPVLTWIENLSKNSSIKTVQRPKDTQKQHSSDKDIDDILDKITKQGYESLTDQEKKKLLNASKDDDN